MKKGMTSTEPQNELKDITLVCTDCGGNFTFEVGEQIFFHNKGFPEPKRCKKCREWRKSTLPNGGVRPC